MDNKPTPAPRASRKEQKPPTAPKPASRSLKQKPGSPQVPKKDYGSQNIEDMLKQKLRQYQYTGNSDTSPNPKTNHTRKLPSPDVLGHQFVISIQNTDISKLDSTTIRGWLASIKEHTEQWDKIIKEKIYAAACGLFIRCNSLQRPLVSRFLQSKELNSTHDFLTRHLANPDKTRADCEDLRLAAVVFCREEETSNEKLTNTIDLLEKINSIYKHFFLLDTRFKRAKKQDCYYPSLITQYMPNREKPPSPDESSSDPYGEELLKTIAEKDPRIHTLCGNIYNAQYQIDRAKAHQWLAEGVENRDPDAYKAYADITRSLGQPWEDLQQQAEKIAEQKAGLKNLPF